MNKITFFESYFSALEELPDEDAVKLYRAIGNFAFKGIEPDFKGYLSAIWMSIKPNIENSIKLNSKKKEAQSKSVETRLQNKKDLQKDCLQIADKDKDKDKDKEEDKDKDKGNPKAVELSDVFNLINFNYPLISAKQTSEITTCLGYFDEPLELVSEAIRIASAERKNVNYFIGVLKNWVNMRVTCISDLAEKKKPKFKT